MHPSAPVQTHTCVDISLLTGVGAPVDLNNFASPPPSPLNINVSVATWLAPPSPPAGGASLVVTGIALLQAPPAGSPGPSVFVVAGNGEPPYPGITPQPLLNATADSNGTLVLLSLDITAPLGTAPTVTRVVKLGGRVDHVRANAGGDVAVAGSFGIAVLSGLAGPGPVSVVWSDALTDTEPGSCGVCCDANGPGAANTTCRVDIGDDGVVAASLAATDAALGMLWAVYSPAGVRTLGEGRQAAGITGVFVDAARRHVGMSFIYNSNTGREPMVMCVWLLGGAGVGVDQGEGREVSSPRDRYEETPFAPPFLSQAVCGRLLLRRPRRLPRPRLPPLRLERHRVPVPGPVRRERR